MPHTLESGTYFGSSIQLHDHDGLSVIETAYPANLRIPAHEHENAFFCFVMSGQATRAWPTRTGAEARMELTLFPAAVPHANCWCSSGGLALHVEFSASWMRRLGSHEELLRNPQDFSAGAPIWIARRLASESRCEDSARGLVVEGLVLEMLAACARTPSAGVRKAAPSWMQRVVERLRESDAVATLAELADEAGVSADHLTRQFRRHFGCTVGQYIRRQRIDVACRALEQDRQSLAEIAFDAGFADHSHFSREFRRHVGYTPTEYRLQFRSSRKHSSQSRNRSS